MIPIDGASLFCKTVGKGPPLIVVHGGPGLTHNYLFTAEFGAHNRAIFYDQRGCGQSTGAIEPLTMEQFVKDLDAVRTHFGYEKVALLGHSWGGFLAMHYAFTHPQHIDALIIANTVPASSDEWALFATEWHRRMEPYLEEINQIQQSEAFAQCDPDTIEHLHRLWFRRYCYSPEKADLLQIRASQESLRRSTQVADHVGEQILSKPYNLYDQLKKLSLPTLIIHGDTDPVPHVTAKNIHRAIPNSRYILLKQCGHFSHVEVPEAFFSAVHAFLATSCGR